MVDNKQQWKAWLYLLPAIILLLVFTVWPIINTTRLAFLNKYSMMADVGGQVFEVGIENFIRVFKFPGFVPALKNTLLLTVITVPVSTLLALLVAVGLNSIKFLNRFLQTIYFLPYVTNSIAIGMVFAMMFNIVGQGKLIVTAGIVNNLLGLFGIEPINWINPGSSYVHNLTVMCIYIIWNALPFKILILLGGLQSVNKQYYDAAKIDAASKSTVFWRITVPLLSPMIAYVVITGFIGGFKEYSSVVGVFGDHMGPAGGIYGSMITMVGFINDSIAGDFQGLASAGALVLFVIILIVTGLNSYVSKKRVHY